MLSQNSSRDSVVFDFIVKRENQLILSPFKMNDTTVSHNLAHMFASHVPFCFFIHFVIIFFFSYMSCSNGSVRPLAAVCSDWMTHHTDYNFLWYVIVGT